MIRHIIIVLQFVVILGLLSACSTAIKATDFEASANIDPVIVQNGGGVNEKA